MGNEGSCGIPQCLRVNFRTVTKIRNSLLSKVHQHSLFTYHTVTSSNISWSLTFRGPCIVSTCIFLLIYFQQDATLDSLFISGKLLYMFRVVSPPIIRSTHKCIYSIWYLSNRYCYLPLLWKSWSCFGAVATAPKLINTFPTPHSKQLQLFHNSGRLQ